MKKIIFLLTLFITTNLVSQKNQHVLYGEKATYYKPSENVFGLFLDKNGDIYPDDTITDEKLIACNASLQEFYQQNPKRFLKIAEKHQLKLTEYSDTNYIIFQDILAREKIELINKFQKNNTLFVLIHGFRKPFIKQDRSTTAMEDYGYLRNSIEKIEEENKKIKFLEIYWDGMFDSFFGEESGSLNDVFILFEQDAQKNAIRTGYALRRIISKIDTKAYNIITHSLGAQVGVSLLTNTYDDKINEEITKLETPSQQKINICLIAPAMAAAPFVDYYQRTTSLNFKQKDNYYLSILFNEKDAVLNKKIGFFGPGPRKYGDTSLGCNYENEIGVLQNMFEENYKNSSLKIYDTSVTRDHRIKNYVETLNFENYIKELLI